MHAERGLSHSNHVETTFQERQMATITSARLSISRDRAKKTATPVVTCGINFTAFEVNQMQQGLRFRLKAQLWGADSGLTGGDDLLFTFPTMKFFPDSSPTSTEEVTFSAVVGEGLLNEDLGTDEIFGKLILTNEFTLN